jgi:hypothetical protein
MYDSFEPFIRVSTWHTFHPKDEEHFYLALNKVVRRLNFDPSAMGDYFRDYLGANAAFVHSCMKLEKLIPATKYARARCPSP